ncbi:MULTISPECIES: SufB/SufD family protein [unclassified Erysipelothrix]|nr:MULTISPECIES: SufD family Fe-S cluster assembly protein [unclassified Erysipelothrix]MBK2401860.1 SufD family Fe-S cluster assembly protein [Erysipelothrix sp. strain 2 (EsS2-6-Brazil)]MBK2404000.1 SufD family Fe-S cluster assembly protein [Erysipelothrix sp. strain 2 (EsS2-7-Brazil)]NBA00947.1 SufD family Fe-S cluster assembly protein [Erysipelothrix rhusiopathiae]
MTEFSLTEPMNSIVLDIQGEEKVSITIPKRATGTLYIIAKGQGSLDLTLHVSEQANFKYLWINQSDEALEVNEHIKLYEHAHLIANYGEMSQGNHQKYTHIEYLGLGSHCEFKGAVIAFNKLKWTVKADHQARKSYAMVECNAIVLNKGSLNLEVIGSIAKGNSGSETHQMSRIMNLGEDVHGVVYPMLLIDENDVAASHAASVGQPNEEHIYYLQSRGLTREDALRLIIMGYLMPIVDAIDDETIQTQLKEEITEKVNTQWIQ